MTFQYLSVDEAIKRSGLRMVVVGGVPSPWGEAAKGMLHIKRIDWVAVRLVYDSEPLKNWAGQRSGPVAIYEQEAPRSGWAEILELAERLAPTPSLLPADPADRAVVLDLANDLCGEGGLAWLRRLQLIHAGLQNSGGFPERVAKYLGKKYGYMPELGADSGMRVAELIGALVARLQAQRAAGSRYLVGTVVSAADVNCATVTAMFGALPRDQCAMDAGMRAAFEMRDAQMEAALDPILFDHRDMVYAKHLELPLSL